MVVLQEKLETVSTELLPDKFCSIFHLEANKVIANPGAV